MGNGHGLWTPKDTPHSAFTGELWGVCCGNSEENWSLYNKTTRDNWALSGKNQVSLPGISNCIPQYSVWYSYLTLCETSAPFNCFVKVPELVKNKASASNRDLMPVEFRCGGYWTNFLHFAIYLLFHNNQNFAYLLNTIFISYSYCHCWTVKFECTSKNLRNTFAESNVLLMEK